MENYKDIPELPNAEPNWNDAQSMNSKGVPENAIGTPDIAPEDDPDAGANRQVAQQFLVDLPEDDGSGLGDMADTASYAGAAAEKKYHKIFIWPDQRNLVWPCIVLIFVEKTSTYGVRVYGV